MSTINRFPVLTGADLRRLRNAKGLRLRDVSERTGIGVSTLHAAEQRDRVALDYAIQILRAFEQAGTPAQQQRAKEALRKGGIS